MANRQRIVLVLANLMSIDGVLNDETAGRVKLGHEIFDREEMDYIFFIGWDYRPDSPIAIADAMAKHMATFADVDTSKILFNRQSRDSVGDAILSRVDLEKQFVDYELSIVSSEYHMARLKHIFPRIYGEGVKLSFFGAPIQVDSEIGKSETKSIAAFDQTFAGIADGNLPLFTKRLLSSHPFYNGKIHPALKM